MFSGRVCVNNTGICGSGCWESHCNMEPTCLSEYVIGAILHKAWSEQCNGTKNRNENSYHCFVFYSSQIIVEILPKLFHSTVIVAYHILIGLLFSIGRPTIYPAKHGITVQNTLILFFVFFFLNKSGLYVIT